MCVCKHICVDIYTCCVDQQRCFIFPIYNFVDYDTIGGSDWKESLQGYLQVEAIVVIKWLNKFVCKKQFSAENFPECILTSYGDSVVDLIEQVRGRQEADVHSYIFTYTSLHEYHHTYEYLNVCS